MKSVLSGMAAVALLALIASFVAVKMRTPAYDRYTSRSVRVGDAGANLVGQNWSGLANNKPGGAE